MQYTTNYNLRKPDYTDDVNIADLNENFDAIDTLIKTLADAAGVTLTSPLSDGE